MDNVRLYLIIALGFISFLLWQAWQEDYAPKPAPQPPVASAPTVGAATPGSSPAAADVPTPTAVGSDVPRATGTVPAKPKTVPNGKLIEVVSDKLRLFIDPVGGTIRQAYLQDYPLSLEHPENKVAILSDRNLKFYILQSGLVGAGGAKAPTHLEKYSSKRTSYVMKDGDTELVVDLVWENDGVSVTKRYTLTRGSHAIRLQHIVRNASGKPLTAQDYRQLQQLEPPSQDSAFIHTYTGGAYYTEEKKYTKIDFGELLGGELKQDVKDGWVGMLQHYFLAAIVPPRGQTQHFYSKAARYQRAVIGTISPAVQIPNDSTHIFDGQLVVGPKLQHELAQIAKGLDLTVDYGWLSVLAQPMFWLFEWIYAVLGNWGWTIIVFTILLKSALYPLSAASYRSMAGMRKLTPRIQALKERYGDDRQRMQQAMMEIYKKEKINPLGGCLPMLVQIPFFISLYWVLLESVELRQAPWILWINDLSVKDKYYVLPLMMGATMFIQQKLNPPPPDPMQAKVMMALPFVFTVFFAFFPAGLVLYWFMNNLLSIAQQWRITKQVEAAAK